MLGSILLSWLFKINDGIISRFLMYYGMKLFDFSGWDFVTMIYTNKLVIASISTIVIPLFFYSLILLNVRRRKNYLILFVLIAITILINLFFVLAIPLVGFFLLITSFGLLFFAVKPDTREYYLYKNDQDLLKFNESPNLNRLC